MGLTNLVKTKIHIHSHI